MSRHSRSLCLLRAESRDCNGITKLSLIHLILPYRICFICCSSDIPLLSLAESSSGQWHAEQQRLGDFNMIYTFENFSWSRPSTIHLSLQIIRHCFSQIWSEPIRNCISLMGQREKNLSDAKESLWIWNDLARQTATTVRIIFHSPTFLAFAQNIFLQIWG